jgi:hypothetical protein
VGEDHHFAGADRAERGVQRLLLHARGADVLMRAQEGEWKDIGDGIRRLKVPGGWLYQVESTTYVEMIEPNPSAGYYEHGWHTPVFVPDSTASEVMP